MATLGQHRNWFLGNSLRAVTNALTILLVLAVFATPSAQTQTFKVIHSFTGGQDGEAPLAGLTIDQAGNLYGTTFAGGLGSCTGFYGNGCGVVFRLAHSATGWIFKPLYSFLGGKDGAGPIDRVGFGHRRGTLYGTTSTGGVGCDSMGCGTVFSLTPPSNIRHHQWIKTVLYSFSGGSDGAGPDEVVFDKMGAIYGTTSGGGLNNCSGGCGTAYKLTPAAGTWTESILYAFTNNADGEYPNAPLIFDKAGNLYGTTFMGSSQNYGAVFQLKPLGHGWVENTLYQFQGGSDGGRPAAGLIFDSSGSLVGATTYAGAGFGGTVFDLKPSNGNWTFSLLYSFAGQNGGGPSATLVMDAAGSLYGTTERLGAYGSGTVFKLTLVNGTWMQTVLHDFTGGKDGYFPFSNVVFDRKGNLYGTATFSQGGGGVVWEIAP